MYTSGLRAEKEYQKYIIEMVIRKVLNKVPIIKVKD